MRATVACCLALLVFACSAKDSKKAQVAKKDAPMARGRAPSKEMPKTPLPVDRLTDFLCDLERAAEEMRISGRLVLAPQVCSKNAPNGRCLECRSGASLAGERWLGTTLSIRLAAVDLKWTVDEANSDEDCLAHLPYEEGARYVAKGRVGKRSLDGLVSGAQEIDLEGAKDFQLFEPKRHSDTLAIETLKSTLCRPLEGLALHLEGAIAAQATACTQAYCPGECCNSCGGEAILKGSSLELPLRIPGVSCGGNECNLTCPGIEDGESYVVRGRAINEAGRTVLQISEHSRSEAKKP